MDNIQLWPQTYQPYPWYVYTPVPNHDKVIEQLLKRIEDLEAKLESKK